MSTAKGIMAIERGIMSPLSRERLLKKQGESCAICGSLTEKLVLDHDHSTGQVRGFICSRCNIKIGYVEKKGGIEVSDQHYNQILDYLHHPPISRCGIAFLGILKVQSSEGFVYGGKTHNYSERVRKMLHLAPDYMTGEEFIEFVGKLLNESTLQ